MFTLAILIGIYSYLIFFLGIVGLLYFQYVFWLTLVYFVIALLLSRNGFVIHSETFRKRLHPKGTSYPVAAQTTSGKLFIFLLFLLILQILVNLIGALGPELAFDALWYHLTLPKLHILSHTFSYIPGGLFYYSAMSQLTEMMYIPSLMFGGEVAAKLVHFSFGLLTCFILYTLSRKLFDPVLSLLSVIIFYSNLVVDWESITAYIDLSRAFFELLSIFAFINFTQTQKRKWFVLSAILLGFAIATKVLALGSLFIFLLLLSYYGFKRKARIRSILSQDLFYAGLAIIIPLPWFIFSFSNTGNPVYPFFTKAYSVGLSISLLNPVNFLQSVWNLFTHSPDPLSPVYIAFLPLLVFVLFRNVVTHPPASRTPPREGIFKIIIFYSILSLLIWYLTPNTGGGRFIVPYLPVYSILIVSVFAYHFPEWFKKGLLTIIIFSACVSIIYRGVANRRYVPVILGQETKSQFLTNNLNFNFGDFYDTDNFFAKNIKPSDKVLLYGFHNIYYVDFPFVDSSYIRRGETFNYIAVQHGTIPQRFANWQVIYHNKKTDVTLYALKRKQWMSY